MKVKCVYAVESDFKKGAKYQTLQDKVSITNKDGYIITDITWKLFEENSCKHYVYFISYCEIESPNDCSTIGTLETFINNFIK